MMYNTAVKASGSHAQNSTDFNGIYRGNGITVFKHDICRGVHDEFWKCDAIHSEIAWRAGYSKFTEGTEAENTTFGDYINGIVKVCNELGKPAFIVCGKTMLKMMNPHRIHPITYKFHNCDAYYAIYNYDGDLQEIHNEYDGRKFLSERYTRILDPCCGYGIITDTAKESILSDISPDCLNYIVTKFELTKE